MVPRRKKSIPERTEEHRTRRSALTDELASFVLRKGLSDTSLRHLAAQHDTSDRMLLYYFRSKEDLLVAVLARISERLGQILAEYSSAGTVTPSGFLAGTLALLGDPRISPFMKIWSEVIARGARGEEPYRKVASTIVADWLRWIEGRLGLPADGRQRGKAASMLAIVEGVTLLEMAHPGSTKGVAGFLVGALETVEED
jgi:AcrR family transcriptional regulator